MENKNGLVGFFPQNSGELKSVSRPIPHIPLFIHTGVFIYGFIL